jgi:hypothetical protein
MKRYHSAPALCAFLIVAAAGAARAQSLDDAAWIELGGFWADVDSTGEFRLPDQPSGVSFDFEQDLGLDDRQTLFSVNAGARAFGRVIFAADYYKLDRESSIELGRDIQFEDVTFPVAAEIDSGFDSDIYRLTVGYSLIHNGRFEFGPAIGLHATSFDIFVAGEARLGETEVAQAVRRRDFLAPLPTVGLYGTWQPTPRITANARIDYMSLGIDDYDGGVTNVQAGVSYAVTRNFDVGVQYRFVDYDLVIEKDSWTGDLDYTFQGPVVFLRASF